MSGTTPPVPPRHRGDIPATELLAKASRSLLEVWGEEMFRNSGTLLEALGQKLIVFNRPAAIEAVLVTQAEVFAAKPAQLSKLLVPLLGEGLFVAEGRAWAGRRAGVERAMAGALESTPDDWAAWPAGATLDVIAEMERISASLLLRLIFGSAADDPREMIRLARAYRGKISGAGLVTLLALPEPLVRLRLGGDAKRIRALVEPLLAQARKSGQGLAAALPEAGARDEAISLFAIGHEALSGLLAAACFLLGQAPEVEAALHAELDSGNEDGPWLRAVLQEALRLYPPLPLIARVAGRATQVGVLPVPKGSIAFVSPWLVHRHADHWEAPDEFRPARFLPDAPPPRPFTYLPFGLGARHCVGEAFTMQAAMRVLAHLARRVRLRPLPGPPVVPRAGLTLSLAERLPMRLERRADCPL
ncbi:cytochrome P450 [Roseococcus sp. SDR]|uniref:cytochrome P450 n=1 Tax=Roseococcus sp. SDR TaxID=2835532 RepID=UPI001BCDE1C1|nr:cytochrome P450 [Roseococcus sp. SDR]MBS7790131.1 cytochrome P450 [Roseococcus sp. SDR]MBV1845445.1 cytochrome P450 [Roseococcus sp. SDR]